MFRLPFFVLILFCIPFANAKEVIMWNQLRPQPTMISSPFDALTNDQIEVVTDVIAYRNAEQRRELSEQETISLKKRMVQLQDWNIDVEQLIAVRDEIIETQRQQAGAVIENLSIKDMKIPGFLVPLDSDTTTPTQFLLVPTAGACVHTPPPPANQIIVVNIDEGFELLDLNTPVWVHGSIQAKHEQSSVDFSDGSRNVESGYFLSAEKIEIYSAD